MFRKSLGFDKLNRRHWVTERSRSDRTEVTVFRKSLGFDKLNRRLIRERSAIGIKLNRRE
jgi:hypothetical protein